mgnify:CR=1 FL=1
MLIFVGAFFDENPALLIFYTGEYVQDGPYFRALLGHFLVP